MNETATAGVDRAGTFHPSSFRLHPLVFILHPSYFILGLSAARSTQAFGGWWLVVKEEAWQAAIVAVGLSAALGY